MNYTIIGTVSSYATIDFGDTAIHFRFNVTAKSIEEAQEKAYRILEGSFSDEVEFVEMTVSET